MSEFQRETRYGVTKIKRLLPKQKDAFFQEFSELCAKHGTKSVACVVVEKGWPIYEEVWDMVQRLAEGREQKIDQLQRQNDELVARVARLSGALSEIMEHGHDPECDSIHYANMECDCGYSNAERVLNETKPQNLQHIEAAAVEKAKASSQMKADCMGKVSFVIENGNCCPQCWHEQDDDCDICHGESGENGSSNLTVQVPWDTMKDIWKMMNESYARELRQQQTNGSDGDE